MQSAEQNRLKKYGLMQQITSNGKQLSDYSIAFWTDFIRDILLWAYMPIHFILHNYVRLVALNSIRDQDHLSLIEACYM